MRFSVIVPVYNVKPFLSRAVDSFIGQSFFTSPSCGKAEIILVDDGSTDGSGELCDEYKKKFPDKICVIHKQNAGCPAARNSGIDNASGDYLVFLDGDDWLEPDLLKKADEVLAQNKIDILEFSYYEVKNGEEKKETDVFSLKHLIAGKPLVRNDYLEKDFWGPTIWNTITSRTLVKENNVRFIEDIWGPDDTLFAIQAGNCAKTFYYMDYQGYNYFIRDNSITHNKNSEKTKRLFDSLMRSVDIVESIESKGDLQFERARTSWTLARCFWFFRLMAEEKDEQAIYEMLGWMQKRKFYPLRKWSSSLCYRFYRALSLMRLPVSIVFFIYRLFPTKSLIWDGINKFRALLKMSPCGVLSQSRTRRHEDTKSRV